MMMTNRMLLHRAPFGWLCIVLVSCGLLTSFGRVLAQSEASPSAAQMTSETDLIAVLASADAPRAEKAIACKRLAVYGSAACVPEISKLLGDAELTSWARITLEAIPGDAPNQALREAASQLEGLPLVGVINSLGVRRDESAVELLSDRLKSGTQEVAQASSLALGKIGSSSALQILVDYLPVSPPSIRSAVAEAANLGADRLRQEGKSQEALQIFDRIRKADLPVQRVIEATRGAILAHGEDGLPLLRQLLQSEDAKLFALGLQTAREISSDQLRPALLEEIASAVPQRSALIVEVLGDLPGKADLKSLQSLAEKGPQEVRLAAITVLGRVGDRTCVDPLLKVASQSSELQAAVRASLVAIPDANVDDELLARLKSAVSDKVLLLELIGLRQIEATDELVKSLNASNAGERSAALQALGETVPQSRLEVLVGQVLKPKFPEDAGAAARALRTAAVRMPDRDACAKLLGDAMKNAPATTKITLLETVAAVAGPESLKLLAEYTKKGDENLRDAGTRLLGEWMTIDVAPVLLDIATSSPADRFQVRAMRGYIRVARQFVMGEEQRVQMCTQAMDAAKNPAEQKLVLEVLQRYPSLGTLKIALQSLKNSAVQNEARAAVKAIAKKLPDNAEAQKLVLDAGVEAD